MSVRYPGRMINTPALLLFLSFIFTAGCQNNQQITSLQIQLDSLRNQLNHSYKPGFGEFMSAIQAHHVKLWFAGKNENWELADFEVKEIKELFDDIRTFETDRVETESTTIIDAPLDSVQVAITQKNLPEFEHYFSLLTNTCNTCHQSVDYGFNVVTIPAFQPFANQAFNANH